MPRTSMPRCSKKRLSSIATIACFITGAISSEETILRLSEPTRRGEHPLAGRVVDDAVALLLSLPRRVELGDVAADPDHEPVGERDEAEEAHQQEEGEQAELADPAPASAVLAARRWSRGATSQNRAILARCSL